VKGEHAEVRFKR